MRLHLQSFSLTYNGTKFHPLIPLKMIAIRFYCYVSGDPISITGILQLADDIRSSPHNRNMTIIIISIKQMCRCAVCGEAMDKTRVHYGGGSCSSCRAFFRRESKVVI